MFKAATGKSFIKEMLLKLGNISKNIKEKLNEEESILPGSSEEISGDKSTICLEFN